MLRIHYSNRFETLASRLCRSLAAADTGPFLADTIVVPSAAVRRRLTLDIARTQGICANVQYTYLANWLWGCIARLLPDVHDRSPFEPALLSWHVYAEFSDQAWASAYPRLADYLHEADAVMRFEMARRMARLYDQYTTYRADWLQAWADGRVATESSIEGSCLADEAWQAELWRRLLVRIDAPLGDPVGVFRQATRILTAPQVAAGVVSGAASSDNAMDGNAPTATAAGPIHIVCLPAIPPLHLSLLQALARHADVELYVLNPCAEFWFDVVDEKRLAALTASGRDAHHEVGHVLLADWGKQTQSQLSLLIEASPEEAVEEAGFVVPEQDTLLSTLQRSILELQDLTPGSVTLNPQERSLEVHVCHSLTREIEVLHDWLLSLFSTPGSAGDAPLRPDEVLIVTPDLEAAAPLVDAVFGTAPEERYIGYTITGQARSEVNPVARILLELLALLNSRFTANAVFGLLQQPMVARRFGLDATDLMRVQTWLRDSGVRWALDAGHRCDLGVPGESAHTWADGLQRLYLGYALPSDSSSPFDARLPAGDVEGSGARALGALWAFIDTLTALRAHLGTPRRGGEWPRVLGEALQRCALAIDAELDDLADVREALASLGEEFERVSLAVPVPLDVVRSALEGHLDEPARGGVPTGRVTVSSMTSLRTLPYRVICIIGLDDGAFPSAVRPDELDLMSRQFRPGDRQRRLDERNLLLDLLVAARDRLYLSYVGRNVRDNSVQPPSVLLSQLLDYLVPAIADAPGNEASLRSAWARLVVEHPLQPFSSLAFDPQADTRQRSHVDEYAQALNRRKRAKQSTHLADSFADEEFDPSMNILQQPFFGAALPEPDALWRDVSLQQLMRFFRNPCRFLLEQRLSIVLPRTEPELLDDEPFVLDRPASWALADRLLPALQRDIDLPQLRRLAHAGTELPPGPFGERYLEVELEPMCRFGERVRQALSEPLLAPRACLVELQVDGRAFRLHTVFANLRAQGLVHTRYATLGALDVLQAWLNHLLLCAASLEGVVPATRVLASDGEVSFRVCEQPETVLRDLLGLYWQGLGKPLPFFPRSAWALVSGEEGLKMARTKWHNAYTGRGEKVDAAVGLALRGCPDPLDGDAAEFVAVANAVFTPLIEHLEAPL